MKLLKLLPLLLLVILNSCDMGSTYVRYTNVVVAFDQKSVPESATVNTPVNIYGKVTTDNGCLSNIRFVFDTLAEKQFELYALADYESTGTCPTVELTADTTVTITPDSPGEYTVKFWNSATTWDLETINVVEVVPGR